MSESTIISLPFELLPEAQDWKIGRVYRVKTVLKQTAVGEDHATFEVVDASSLEVDDRSKRKFLSDTGTTSY